MDIWILMARCRSLWSGPRTALGISMTLMVPFLRDECASERSHYTVIPIEDSLLVYYQCVSWSELESCERACGLAVTKERKASWSRLPFCLAFYWRPAALYTVFWALLLYPVGYFGCPVCPYRFCCKLCCMFVEIS